MEQGVLERNQSKPHFGVIARRADQNCVCSPTRGEKGAGVISHITLGARPPLSDSDETEPRILNVVLDSQSNKYGDKWVRVWRRAIKMIEELKGVIYDEGLELNSENLAS